MFGETRLPAGFQDGTSNTILFAEKRAGCQNGNSNGSLWAHGTWNPDWMPIFAQTTTYGSNALLPPQPQPTDATCVPYRASAFSAGGCQVAMGDASVRNVSTSVSTTTWQYALTPSGGEVLPSDW